MLATHPCAPLLFALGETIVGKDEALRLVVAALLANGHVLLEDVPGVGKTRLARTLAQLLGGQAKRVQFSPDLLPSDLTGVNVFHPGAAQFRFNPGPVFAHVLLADEINRASPRTQSALLEAMEERRVTIDDETHRLPEPFLVIATQNPVEHHGTFPLPEAQLDRFAVAVSLGYPEYADELRLLSRAVGQAGEPGVTPVTDPRQLMAWQAEVAAIQVEASLQRYVLDAIRRTRESGQIALGVSPRGALQWQRLAQALAWLDGRRYVIPDDLRHTAESVLAHRILSAQPRTLRGKRQLIAATLEGLAVPD